MKTMKPSAQKAYQHFLDNPGAKPMAVAQRFKLSVPYVYKLRDKAAGKREAGLATRLYEARNEALSVLAAHKRVDLDPPVWVAEGEGEPNETLDKTLDKTLDSRAKTYGAFRDNSRLAQALKRAMAEHAEDMKVTFDDDQWEALEMIASKMARIVNGNSDHVDSWLDIAGYATLIADRLRGVIR